MSYPAFFDSVSMAALFKARRAENGLMQLQRLSWILHGGRRTGGVFGARATTRESWLMQILLAIAAILVCQGMQALDDFLSRVGGVSLAHGMLLGYGQMFVAKTIVEWGGSSLGWTVVVLICIASVGVSLYKIHRFGSRWVFAFNFGVLVGLLYGGISLM